MAQPNIKQEARRNARLVTDLDNLRRKQQERVGDLSVIFPAFEVYSFERNYFDILSQSKNIPYIPIWDYRPDLVSYYYYNTTVYWPFMLFLNRVDSIEDFKGLSKLTIPPFEAILQMAKNKIPNDAPAEKINYGSPTSNLVELYKVYPLDSKEISKRENKIKIQKKKEKPSYVLDHVEKEESFTLTSQNLVDKYVELVQGTPANTTSILLYVDDVDVPKQYGYDYVLTVGSTQTYNRVSWNENDTGSSFLGLSSLLKVGSVLTITYIESNLYRYKTEE